MCAAWTSRTGIPTTVLRPVMILDDSAMLQVTEDKVELGAFVHVEDVVAAVREPPVTSWMATMAEPR